MATISRYGRELKKAVWLRNAWKRELRDLGKPREFVFLLSHMRGYTSLLSHLLNEHEEIDGYVETHRSYTNVADAVSLTLDVRCSVKGALTGRYIFDKLLFNYANVEPSFFERLSVKFIFALRPPAESVASIVRMATRNGPSENWKADPIRAAEYYRKRLNALVKFGSTIPASSGVFIETQQLIDSPPLVLNSLEQFLDLASPLPTTYSVNELTGKPRYGDPGEHILQGKIVPDTSRRAEDIGLPGFELDQLTETFELARQSLSSRFLSPSAKGPAPG